MLEKLKLIADHYDEINQKLMDPNVINDNNLYRDLMKEYKNLTPIVEKYKELQKASDDFEEAKTMLEAGGLDKDFKELLQEQYDESREMIDRLQEEAKILLLPKDPNDDKNVIVEIRGGAGGEEAALFVNSLYRMYTMYAESKRWKVEVINANPTELGGFKEISFSIDGEGAYSRLKFESGVHRVQRVPETETQGRVHTSTVTVAVLPEAEEVEFEINPVDLQRRGRPARQQNRVRHPHHPPAHRRGGRMSGRAQPDEEQGKSHEGAPLPPLRGQSSGAGSRRRRRAEKSGGHRRPLRADPHLQLPSGPHQRPPHRPDHL